MQQQHHGYQPSPPPLPPGSAGSGSNDRNTSSGYNAMMDLQQRSLNNEWGTAYTGAGLPPLRSSSQSSNSSGQYVPPVSAGFMGYYAGSGSSDAPGFGRPMSSYHTGSLSQPNTASTPFFDAASTGPLTSSGLQAMSYLQQQQQQSYSHANRDAHQTSSFTGYPSRASDGQQPRLQQQSPFAEQAFINRPDTGRNSPAYLGDQEKLLRQRSASPFAQSGQPGSADFLYNPSRPPISVMTSPSPSRMASFGAMQDTPPDMQSSRFINPHQQSSMLSMDSFLSLTTAGDGSSSSYAFALGASLDPTSMIYDENTGGYATPSYAGSYADDSSFDDRDDDFGRISAATSLSQHESKTTSTEPVRQVAGLGTQSLQAQSDLRAPFGGADLLAFRESVQHKRDWDDISSASGYARSSVSEKARGGREQSSPDMHAADGHAEAGQGLEMAVERMAGPSGMISTSVPDATLRATTASPPHDRQFSQSLSMNSGHSAHSVLTASPNSSPRLRARQVRTEGDVDTAYLPMGVPRLSRLSPSPSPQGPAFQIDTVASNATGIPSSSLSPPLAGTRNSSLAPLAIPTAPDLMLTAATPTAVPKTATPRQDSTQAALDTVFSQFFNKRGDSERKDSTEMPSSNLPDLDNVATPIARQPQYGLPAGDLTLDLGAKSPYLRQFKHRPKAETYMTSPIMSERVNPFEPPLNGDGQRSHVSAASTVKFERPERNDTDESLPAIDPKALDGTHVPAMDPRAMSAPPGDVSLQMARQRYSLAGSSPSLHERPGSGSFVTYRPPPSGFGTTSSPNADQVGSLVADDVRRASSSSSSDVPQNRGAPGNMFPTPGFTPRTAAFDLDFTATGLEHLGAGGALQSLNIQRFGNFDTQFQTDIPTTSNPLPDLVNSGVYNLPDPGPSNFGGYNQYPQQSHTQSNFGFPQAGQGSFYPNQYPDHRYPTMPQTFDPNGYSHSLGPQAASFGSDGHLYLPSDEDVNMHFHGTLMAGQPRRRTSSVYSDTSGFSGLSHVGEVSIESKTTEATKQAARRRRKDPNNAKFACEYCGETFTRAYNLKGHIRSHEGSKPFVCEVCNKGFARRHDLKRHELLHTGVKKYQCEACAQTFVRLDALQRHHKSENGAACIVQIENLMVSRGVEL